MHWSSEADYHNFVETSDTDARLASIGRALESLSGKAEARMSGIPTYTVARVVGPGPRRHDA